MKPVMNLFFFVYTVMNYLPSPNNYGFQFINPV